MLDHHHLIFVHILSLLINHCFELIQETLLFVVCRLSFVVLLFVVLVLAFSLGFTKLSLEESGRPWSTKGKRKQMSQFMKNMIVL